MMSKNPPKRLSAATTATSGKRTSSILTSGSSKRTSSMSRLPVPASSGKGQKRSSSTGRQASALVERSRNLVTPSNPRTSSRRDAFTTPQRVSMATQPRMSMTGTASKRMSGRGSAMGARTVKDTRPLTDKSYQQSQIRKILDFLRDKGYSNPGLTSSGFAKMSTKEFVNIFNFLYSFLDPALPNILPMPERGSRFEEKTLEVLKMIQYPASIPKAHFQSIGSGHSLPSVLGCLAYLCDCVLILSAYKQNINAIAFPSVDEDGLPINKANKNKVLCDHFIKCYHKFQNDTSDYNDMDFTEDYEQLFQELLENQEVNMAQIRDLESKLTALKAEFKDLQGQGSNIASLTERHEALSNDIKKMGPYLKACEESIKMKKIQLAEYPGKQRALLEQVNSLSDEIAVLMEECKQSKHDPREAERNRMIVVEKQDKISNLGKELEDLERHNDQHEIKLRQSLTTVNDLTRQINSMAFEANVTTTDGSIFKLDDFRLNQTDVYLEVKDSMVSILKQAKVDKKELTKEVEKINAVYEEQTAKIKSLERSSIMKKSELEKILDETARTKERIYKEEESLDARLSKARDKLMKIKSEEREGCQKYEQELTAARVELEKVKEERRINYEKGRLFLSKTVEKTMSYLEECKKLETKCAVAVASKLSNKVEEVKSATAEIEETCRGL